MNHIISLLDQFDVMNKIVLCLYVFSISILLTVHSQTLKISPPIWPSTFTSDFVQTADGPTGDRSSGFYWYDFANNRERTDRSNTFTDQLCNTLIPDKNTPCTNLMKNDKRYIYFPDIKSCCVCCNTAQRGCAILKPNWLQGAIYQGQQTRNGQVIYHWLYAYGPTKIDYYQWEPERLTVGQIYRIKSPINTAFYFQVSNTNAIKDSIFDIPTYCDQNVICPKSSACSQFQLSEEFPQ